MKLTKEFLVVVIESGNNILTLQLKEELNKELKEELHENGKKTHEKMENWKFTHSRYVYLFRPW